MLVDVDRRTACFATRLGIISITHNYRINTTTYQVIRFSTTNDEKQRIATPRAALTTHPAPFVSLRLKRNYGITRLADNQI